MQQHIIEVTGSINWGKFLLLRFDTEWRYRSAQPDAKAAPLLRTLGWTPNFLWVLDLQTGEGAFFHPGGLAKADLEKHRIWVCPMYEPFLNWLYEQDLSDITKLPAALTLTAEQEAGHGDLYGHRREGPVLCFTPTGVCGNCLNGAHRICSGSCTCAERGHRQWWFRTDGIKDEAEALKQMQQPKKPKRRRVVK